MYIPLSELSQELDILRKVTEMEVTLTLGQLFKWSPKARSEILKALTRKKKENDVMMLDTNVSIVRTVQTRSIKKDGDVPMGVVTINGEKTNTPIDPRSRLNLMHEKYAKGKGLTWRSVNGKGRMADDSVSNFLGYIPNVEVDAEGVKVTQGFYVMGSASFDVLLGILWIAAAKCDLKYKEVSFVTTTVPESWTRPWNNEDDEFESDDEGDDLDVLSIRRIQIDKPKIEKMDAKYKEIIIKANNSNQLLLEELTPINDDRLEGTKHRGQVIYWNADQENRGVINVGGLELVMRLTVENNNRLDINPEIPIKSRNYLINQLINVVPDVFAFGLSEIGKTSLIEYEVRTGGKVIPETRMRPIRINNPERVMLFENQLREIVKYVKKKEGGTDQLRVVGDMRPLNKYIMKDSYLLPMIRDIIEKAVGHDWYSSVDAYKGYWQIQIREENRDKVAVTTPIGLMRYTVMCMGLKNTSETFQRLMDIVLEGDEWRNITAAYQDDVGLWTDGSVQDHIDAFIKLAHKFKNVELTFAAKKCHLLYRELCMYSKVAKPLTDLTKQNVGYHWKSKQEQSFQELKRLLVDNVMLKAPDWQKAKSGERLYQMYTDACDVSLEVVLEQKDSNNQLRPVLFESRKLNEHEVNYTITEKECLDHYALEWLFNKAMLKGRLMRWVLALQTFDFQVRYKPGKLHGNADEISRYSNSLVQQRLMNDEYIENLLMSVNMEDQKSTANGKPSRRVIFDIEEKRKIVIVNYEGIAGEGEHREINSCVRKILMNYEWASGPMHRTSAGHEHIVVAVEDLTGFIEAQTLKRKNAKSIAQFI
ncbi:6111_t:CDS:2 [Scutellospora calospora]|uniref:6111_t:CDS:1 n=1 Tax=Scutellospora calospora TaxID=85575 RepID=A0ACA9LPQ8_9GLOM|nr:6111_t:CDS:2 [Scutellospora calospora]